MVRRMSSIRSVRDPLHARYYAAMRARDVRFDGKFFVGVKTTGIYCRPVCPARPKRENVEFFFTRRAAERAGYRPCRRCRPETRPHSPAWVGTKAVLQRALKLLEGDAALEMLELNEDQFAARFGMSARHLRRLFNAELGRTPKQVAFSHRLAHAHHLVTTTVQPITEIALAAGFRSIRRFNDAFKARYRQPPSALRKIK
ncbi:MAG: bifunctional transcriptional activator/DNA repair enzyme AdaA [Bacteriovoracia bacterium]